MPTWCFSFSDREDCLFVSQIDLLTYSTECHISDAYPTYVMKISSFFKTLWKLRDSLTSLRTLTWQLDNGLFMSVCPIREEPEIRPLTLLFHNKEKEITIKSLSEAFSYYQILDRPKFTIFDFQKALRLLGDPKAKEYKYLNFEDYLIIKAPMVVEE